MNFILELSELVYNPYFMLVHLVTSRVYTVYHLIILLWYRVTILVGLAFDVFVATKVHSSSTENGLKPSDVFRTQKRLLLLQYEDRTRVV